MKEQTLSCSQCGGALKFSPGQQSLLCPYCGNNQSIGDAKRPSVQVELDFESALSYFETHATEEVRVVSCAACGGETTFPPNVESGFCDFCSTPLTVKGETIKAMKPQYLLPFAIEKDDAETRFKTWLKKRWFAPNALTKLARIEDPLKGIYLPFWTFDSDTTTQYVGERGENYTVEVQSKDANGNTVTRHETRIRWYPVSGTVSRAFDDVLVPASKSLPESLTKKLDDWPLDEMVEYNDKFLAGFKSETYSVQLRDGFSEAQEEMESVIDTDIRHHIGGDHQRIHSRQTQYDNITFKYVQLPIWALGYRFGDKMYSVLVNGRTGEVTGTRPWSAVKITLLVLGIAALGVGAYLVYHFAR